VILSLSFWTSIGKRKGSGQNNSSIRIHLISFSEEMELILCRTWYSHSCSYEEFCLVVVGHCATRRKVAGSTPNEVIGAQLLT
jgi:hypothetical protein